MLYEMEAIRTTSIRTSDLPSCLSELGLEKILAELRVKGLETQDEKGK